MDKTKKLKQAKHIPNFYPVIRLANTKHDYDHYELLSALQKSIRRGIEYDAVHFVVELEEFNPSLVWNRLKVIA